MAEYLPKFDEGDTVTITAAATITGGQLVNVDGTVSGTASTTVAGVAGHDAISGRP
jgi:predicted RecA/RadA family phage recombinase